MKSKPSSPPVPIPELGQRWPDLALIRLFLNLKEIYERLVRAQIEEANPPAVAMQQAYQIACQMMEKPLIERRGYQREHHNGPGPERFALASLVSELKHTYGRLDWLQSVASLLGMLMHLSWNGNGTPGLVNRRRPQRSFSSYPNSPAVGAIAGEAVISKLFREPVPSVCNRAINAERYAERALDFRILDPSMESGQLLLDIALACIRRVESRHSPTGRSGQRLIQALLKKLCADCLFGVDRNALALPSTRLVFYLLGAEYGIERLLPDHLFTADSLSCFPEEQYAEFDGVINNPPWGEVTNHLERRTLRKRFDTIDSWVDTYVPFTELDIRCLRPGGALALIIPSQVIAMRHAAKLREMILNKVRLDQIILLPRAAFVDATVRAVMILGSARETKITSGMCRVITYPFKKRIETIAPVRTFDISLRALNRAGRGSWSPVLHSNGEHGTMRQNIELGRLADFTSGMQVYVRNAGEPPQTAQIVREHPFTFVRPAKGRIPVIRGREVKSYRLEEPQQFVKFGRWLAWTGKHDDQRWRKRIFVRELHRRDGKLTAAISKRGVIPLKGVITVIPRMIDPYALLGILNSTVTAQHVLHHGSSSSKVDFQRITLAELGTIPVPGAAIDPSYHKALGLSRVTKRDSQLRNRLIDSVRKLSRMPILRDARREKLQADVDEMISEMYWVARKSDA